MEQNDYSRELLVGANASMFFPFLIEIDGMAPVENGLQYIYLRLLEKQPSMHPNEIHDIPIYEAPFTIPSGAFKKRKIETPIGQKFQTNLRIYGEGIKEEINRYIDISFSITFWRNQETDNVTDLCLKFCLNASDVRVFWKKKKDRLLWHELLKRTWFEKVQNNS
jgi:hypothetical protein